MERRGKSCFPFPFLCLLFFSGGELLLEGLIIADVMGLIWVICYYGLFFPRRIWFPLDYPYLFACSLVSPLSRSIWILGISILVGLRRLI